MKKNIGVIGALTMASAISAQNNNQEANFRMLDSEVIKTVNTLNYGTSRIKKPNYSKSEMAAIKKRRNKNKAAKKARKKNR